MKEYSMFTSSNLVRKMVEDDDKDICCKFFKDESDLVLDYRENFFLLVLEDKDEYAVPCMINMIDQDNEEDITSHCILFIKEGDDYFFFDSSGRITREDRYLYYNHGCMYDSKELKQYLKETIGINVHFPKKKGVGRICDASIYGYIEDGGYCMFFVREAIDYIVKNKEKGLIRCARELVFKDLLTYGKDVHKNSDILFEKYVNSKFHQQY